MSKRKRRKFTAEFKAKVVLEALTERYTLTEIAQKYDLQPVQISKWKREFKQNMSQVFETPKAKDIKRQEERESHLYEQIGRLQVQLEWLKKKWTPSIEQKRMWIDPEHPTLSIVEQCELLDLPRSTYYFQPATESELNLRVMRLIDEQYMKEPSWGVPRMTSWVNKKLELQLNMKRIKRLMRIMGLRGLVPNRKKVTSLRAAEHQSYPYLLSGLEVRTCNQVWVSDITYIPMHQGFMYLVAIMDLFSRYVVSWELSNSMETQFCLDALERALEQGQPGIFNTDKGSQYTSTAFINRLLQSEIQPSMTGKGRCWDNIHAERLWWSVKYENVYLREYQDGVDLFRGLSEYFHRYNTERPHQALQHRTPEEVYYA